MRDTNSDGTNALGGSTASMRSAALKQSLGLVDEISTGAVTPLETGAETLLHVDATAGGLDGSDEFPWIYVSLATLRVALPWASVDVSTQGQRALPTEQWLDADCNLSTGEGGDLLDYYARSDGSAGHHQLRVAALP